jgi:hypothetical protein
VNDPTSFPFSTTSAQIFKRLKRYKIGNKLFFWLNFINERTVSVKERERTKA